MKILISERFADFRSILATALRIDGHQVEEADDNFAPRLAAEDFDLVILDVDFRKNASEQLLLVRESRPQSKLCLMSTNPSQMPSTTQGMEGVLGRLKKPFTMDELREVMSRANHR